MGETTSEVIRARSQRTSNRTFLEGCGNNKGHYVEKAEVRLWGTDSGFQDWRKSGVRRLEWWSAKRRNPDRAHRARSSKALLSRATQFH